MKIAIGCDHIVTDMKNALAAHLLDLGYEVIDCGTWDRKRTHYPIYGRAVGRKVAEGEADFGIVLCGTGIGISNAASKVPGVRCVLAGEPLQAEKARWYADANVLAMGGRVIGQGKIEEIAETFLKTPAAGANLSLISRLNELGKEQGVLEEDLFDDLLKQWDAGTYHD